MPKLKLELWILDKEIKSVGWKLLCGLALHIVIVTAVAIVTRNIATTFAVAVILPLIALWGLTLWISERMIVDLFSRLKGGPGVIDWEKIRRYVASNQRKPP